MSGPVDVWQTIRSELEARAREEPCLQRFLDEAVFQHDTLAQMLAHLISTKLACPSMPESVLHGRLAEALQDAPGLVTDAELDIAAVIDRDPACDDYHAPLLFFKGVQALQVHRVAHWCWQHGQTLLARYLQSRSAEVFAVDIHPAARLGSGILVDHATSIVIGETAVVEDHVSLLHEVTLGGTGKEHGDRHPKVRKGVLIGAGAKILGNVEIGTCSKIGAGSVVLTDVPPHTTVAGVPARIVGRTEQDDPAAAMDHSLPDCGA